MTKDDLMLLPPPNRHGGTYESSPFNYYTADQMREYANLVAAAEQERCIGIIRDQRGLDYVAQRTVDAIRSQS
jgi:hypothetical protein